MLICPEKYPQDKFIRVLEKRIRNTMAGDVSSWSLKIRKIKPDQNVTVLLIGNSISHHKGGEAETIAVSILQADAESAETKQLEALVSFVEGFKLYEELPEGAELLSETVKCL